jgi:hypothetical protein
MASPDALRREPGVPEDAVTAALAVLSRVRLDLPDPMVLSDRQMVRNMLEAAAPAMAGGEHDERTAIAVSRVREYAIALPEARRPGYGLGRVRDDLLGIVGPAPEGGRP